MIEGDKIHLEAGKSITLTTTTVTGTADHLSISFDRLPSMLESGSTILLDDGLIQLAVEHIPDDKTIVCKILNSGSIRVTARRQRSETESEHVESDRKRSR